MRAYQFATVRPAATVFHMQPVGNRHTLCGRIAEHTEDMYVAARAENFATRRLCKTCARVTPARDTRRPVDPYLSEPTDVWTVTNKAGVEVSRVYGTTMEKARWEALECAEVRRVNYAENGFSLRRLTVGQLKAPRV